MDGEAAARLQSLAAQLREVSERVLAARSTVRGLKDASREPSAGADATGREGSSAESAAPGPTESATAEAAVTGLEQRLAELESSTGDAPGPGTPQARSRRLFHQGHELFAAGDWVNASAALRDALDVESSDYATALFELGEALWHQRLWSSALPYLKRVLARPSPSPHDADAALRAMDCAYKLGEYREVTEILALAQKTRGSAAVTPEALYLAGKAAFRRTDVPSAIRDSSALALFTAMPPPFELAAAYHRGAIHLRAGNLEAAVKEFETCDHFLPKDERQRDQHELCWLALGRAYTLRDVTEAAYWYGQIPPQSRHNVEAMYEWAYTDASLGLHKPALTPLGRLPDGDSALDADIALVRGSVFSSLGRHGDALNAFELVRSKYGPLADELDRIDGADRDPVHYLQWLSLGSGRSHEPSTAPPLPPALAAWAKSPGDVDGALDVLDTVETLHKITSDLGVEIERAQAALSRGDDTGSFPHPEARRARAKALTAAALRLEGQLAALERQSSGLESGGPPGASFRLRAEQVRARAERLDLELLRASRARAHGLGAQLASAVAQVAAIDAELSRMRSEAQDLAARLAHGSFQRQQARLHYQLLAAERGIARVALARAADAGRRIQALLFRRMVEKTLSMSAERTNTQQREVESRSRVADAEQRIRRDEAVSLLESYVQRHLDDPVFTPQALLRLGELQYEKGSEGEAVAREAPALAPSGSNGQPKGCASTLALYEHDATSFPSYQQKDSLQFLLGYCLVEMGRPADAIRVYGDLVRRFPESSYASEAGVRIGDLSFEEDKPESLRRAIEAYSTLRARSDHPLYVHALYMLGWAYYRAGNLDRAVESFTQVLEHEATGTDRQAAGEQSAEALRQLVATFAPPRWDGEGRAKAWFESHHTRAYDRDVFLKARPITPPSMAAPTELEHVESFLPKVLEALEKEPF